VNTAVWLRDDSNRGPVCKTDEVCRDADEVDVQRQDVDDVHLTPLLTRLPRPRHQVRNRELVRRHGNRMSFR